jgi:hypothetical protein
VENLKLKTVAGSEGAGNQPSITDSLPEPVHRTAIGIGQL